jgi:tetratricopeptide (TPR) repeat protein
MQGVSGGMEQFLESVKSFLELHEELKREADRRAGEEEARARLADGLRHFRAGRASRAVKELRKCVALGEAAPRNARAVLAAAMIDAGDPEAGAELLARVIEELPEEAEPRANLAHAHALRGDFEGAAEAARGALERDPRCGAALNTLGNALFALGETAEGVDCWMRAVEVEPGLEAAWMNLVRQRLVSPAEADAALLRERGQSTAPDPVEPDRAPEEAED